DWNRRCLFIAGGSTEYEQETIFLHDFQLFDSSATYGGIALPPLKMSTTLIKRTDFSQGTDITQVAELQSEFRRGNAIVDFEGHGATFVTDVNFGDAASYRNQGLYPIFMTLSCRTGAFAEPNSITLNES